MRALLQVVKGRRYGFDSSIDFVLSFSSFNDLAISADKNMWLLYNFCFL